MSTGFLHGNGGVSIQRKSGTATPFNGTAFVNVGFKPDIVMMPWDTIVVSGTSYNGGFTFPFAEDNRSPLIALGSDENGKMVFVECTRNDNGFTSKAYTFGEDGVPSVITNYPSFQYTAVKYT